MREGEVGGSQRPVKGVLGRWTCKASSAAVRPFLSGTPTSDGTAVASAAAAAADPCVTATCSGVRPTAFCLSAEAPSASSSVTTSGEPKAAA